MLNVTALPAFNDNYIWALSNKTDEIVVVDPGDASVVENHLKENNLTLAAILITHHHADHTGGVNALNEAYNIPVYGPESSPFPGITHHVKDNQTISVLDVDLTVRTVPGHTLDHICYINQGPQSQLFCGDTLFLAGCGRLFEGTAEQMLSAMNLFKALPSETQVFCTHEYSLANLAFAEAVEPNNKEITLALKKCQQLRSEDTPTVPSSIAQEIKINPFMRTTESTVIAAAEAQASNRLTNEVDVFAALREWKNNF